MSKDNDIWATPPEYFEKLDRIFKFTCDVCALPFNTKVLDNYFTPEDDGLKQKWSGVCWMNPPFSESGKWVEKAVKESENGTIVVALLPSFVDTSWWRNYVHKKSDMIIPTKRLRFLRYSQQITQIDLNGDKLPASKKATSRFGCCIVVWGITEYLRLFE